MEAVWRRLQELPAPERIDEEEPETIVAPEAPVQPLAIEVPTPGTYRVRGTAAEHAAAVAYVATREGLARFHRELAKLGVVHALEAAGADEGDTVLIADLEFDYVPDYPA
jgi:Obg family GTPase CgtA-like protein